MISYTKLSSNIKLETYDPLPFTDLEDLATTYGIQGLQLNQEGERFDVNASARESTLLSFNKEQFLNNNNQTLSCIVYHF